MRMEYVVLECYCDLNEGQLGRCPRGGGNICKECFGDYIEDHCRFLSVLKAPYEIRSLCGIVSQKKMIKAWKEYMEVKGRPEEPDGEEDEKPLKKNKNKM
ncbi:MAG: hypothetical protein LBU36_05400 [Clostridiales bacterium]|jgi:hypothetical protein|nr:hypothetical protein [Clostridiales bacterium]